MSQFANAELVENLIPHIARVVTNSPNLGLDSIITPNDITIKSTANDVNIHADVGKVYIHDDLIINSSVGINTTPVVTLDVRNPTGNETIQIAKDNNNKIFFEYDEALSLGKIQTVFGAIYTGDIAIQPDGGSVGIGTNSPDTRFHISGGDSSVAAVQNGVTLEDDTHHYLTFKSPANSATGLLFYSGAEIPDASILWEDGTRGNYLKFFAATSLFLTSDPGLTVLNDGIILDHTDHQYVTFRNAVNKQQGLAFYAGSDTLAAAITFDDGSLGDIMVFNAPEFTFNNNVGIGINPPSADLHIKSAAGTELLVESSGASQVPKISIKDLDNGQWNIEVGRGSLSGLGFYEVSGDTRMFLEAGGYVGIGTTNPGTDFHVYNTVNPKILVECGSAGNIPALQIKDYDNGQWNLEVGRGSLSGLGFYENGSGTRMFLEAGGYVGVGITNPTSKFHVYDTSNPKLTIQSSDASYPGINIVNTVDSVAMFIDPSGNFKILVGGSDRIVVSNGGDVTIPSGAGNLGVGISPSYGIHASGSIATENVYVLKELASSPSTPPTGYGYIYLKTDGKFYAKNDAGTETALT